MKIFKFGGGTHETDWVVAENADQATQHYLEDVQDLTPEEIVGFVESDDCDMVELSTEEVDALEFRNGESSDAPMISAKDLIAEMISEGRVLPFHLASTCF